QISARDTSLYGKRSRLGLKLWHFQRGHARRHMAKKASDQDKPEKPQRDYLTLIVFGALMFVALLMSDQSKDPAGIVFVVCSMGLWIGFTKIAEYLKDRKTKAKETVVLPNPDSTVLKERLENLEALICRLDTEINTQLEQSFASGGIPAIPPSPGVSQLPTTFMNIASALEDRYQVLPERGGGGMGIVFQAHNKHLNEQVAIKILSPLPGANAEALARLKREVTAARRIAHPNIIRIHDIGDAKGLQF